MCTACLPNVRFPCLARLLPPLTWGWLTARAAVKELLQKLEYNKYVDHLVFTGDVVTKGPDSLRVVDFARQHGASCVRGNQDDRILLHHRSLAAAAAAGTPPADESPELDKKVHGEKKLARHMTDEQAAWLDSCPLMLRARDVYGLGDVVVVHAGLVQGVALEQQVGAFPYLSYFCSHSA